MKNNRVKPGLSCALVAMLVLAGCASKSLAPVSTGSRSSPGAVVSAVKDTYTVKSGDTLYSIAREHGMDFRELIALNEIDSPNRIVPGKVLKIRPQGAQPATSAVASTAPVTSDVVVARPIGAEAGGEQRPLASNTETIKREPKAGKEAYSAQALAKAQAQPTASAPVAASAAASAAKPAEQAASGDEVAWVWPANGKTIGSYGEGSNKGIDIAGKAGDPVIAAGDGKVAYSGQGLRGLGKLVVIKHNATYLSAYAHNQTILVKEGQMVSKGQKIAEMGNTDTDQVKLHFEVRRLGKPVDPLKYLPQH